MGFLSPWFLAGAAAVGLPLWIHLLRQYRSTPHPFSSLMFFERRTQSSIQHRRLRYLLLLSLRAALLILMAIAFANPFVTRAGAHGGGKKTLIVAVDNSFSMRYGDRLARARREALSALSNLKPGEQGQALTVGARVSYLTQPTGDAAQLRAAIAAIQPSDSRSSFGEFARALRAIAQSSRAPLEVHFIGDMQKSSMPPAFADLRLPAGANLVLHSVAEANQPNWMVESVTAPGKIYDPKKARVQAVVAGVGAPDPNGAPAHRTVSLALDGKTLESKSVDIPPNGRATVEFLSLESPYGFHRGEIRIEPGDALREDDRFPFAVERTEPHRALFLHEAGRNRGELYYRAALEASSEAGFAMEPLAVDQAANASLSKYAFVVLSDVPALPAGLEDSLRTYVDNGGGLLIALGPSAAALPKVPVTGETIAGSQISTREGERFQTVASIEAEHPAVRRANKLEGVEFYQAVRVEPGGSRVIARLTDRTPLLLEKQIGEGRALVFASTFDNISNDFPLHASFLPFVEQSARYVGAQLDKSTNVAVDSYLELRSAKERGASVEVIDPDGRRPLSLKEASTAQSFQVTREGFYSIHRGNNRDELAAVHADRRESDLTPESADKLELWRNTGRGAPDGSGPDGSGPDGSAPGGAEDAARPWGLGRYALMAVLAIAIVESVIASRYLSIEKEAA